MTGQQVPAWFDHDEDRVRFCDWCCAAASPPDAGCAQQHWFIDCHRESDDDPSVPRFSHRRIWGDNEADVLAAYLAHRLTHEPVNLFDVLAREARS